MPHGRRVSPLRRGALALLRHRWFYAPDTDPAAERIARAMNPELAD